MGDKQSARAEKVRRKHGVAAHVPLWTSENGWAAYEHGVLVVRMDLSKRVLIPVQDLTSVEVKLSGDLNKRGKIRFNRKGDTFTTRQELIFSRTDEPLFLQLEELLNSEVAEGVHGQRLPVTEPPKDLLAAESPEDLSEAKYRTKYKIPEKALLARALGRGYVSFDGHFVTIQHVALGRFTVGKGIKRIPVTAISSVQVKMPGWVMVGYIQFSLPGGNEVRSEFGRQTFDATKDENTMAFEGSEAPAFLAVRDAIEAAQRALHQPAAAQMPTSVPDDVFAQLEKLGKLRDAGIISPDEFDAKKGELLARM